MPTPRSNPSSTTYATSMSATSQYQMNPMDSSRHRDRGSFRHGGHAGRAGRDDAINQDNKQDRKHGINSHEPQQRKQPVAGGNVFGIAVGCPDEPLNHPGLPPDLGGHPPGRIADV